MKPQETILFQFLGSNDLYSLDQARQKIRDNPDLLWIVYQSRRGSAVHDNGRIAPIKRIGQMDSLTVEQKFG